MSKILEAVKEMEIDNLQGLIAKEDREERKLVDSWFTTIQDLFKQINILSNVKNSIETYGITNDIISNNKEVMWNTFEFDLEMFRNPTNAQTNICLEALNQTLANIIKRAIEIIDKIIDFLMVDSGFARYLNRMEMYRHMVNERIIMIKDFDTVIDPGKLNNCIITSYPFDVFNTTRSALASIIQNINGIDGAKAIPTIEDLIKTFGKDLSNIRCTLGPNGGIDHDAVANPLRRDAAISLQWNMVKFREAGIKLSDDILSNTAKVTRARYAVIRTMRNFKVSLVDMLNGRTTPSDPNSEVKTSSCNAIKNILTTVIDKSCGLAFIWSNNIGTIYNTCKKSIN